MYSQSMKSQTDMQQFIQYKLHNKSSSQQQAKAYKTRKKYQRQLNEKYQLVSLKQKQRKVVQYDVKKIRKQVWNQLINISNYVEKLEKQRHAIANILRELRESREQSKRQLQHMKKSVNKTQQQLQHKINTSQSQFRQYQSQKQAQTINYRHKSAQYKQKIDEIEPTVLQYHQQTKSQQESMERIVQFSAKIKQKTEERQFLKQKLQELNVNAIKAMNEREEQQRRITNKKKSQIETVIHQINTMLNKDAEINSEDQLRVQQIKQYFLDMKKKYQLTQQQNKQRANIKQSKIKQISLIIEGSAAQQNTKVLVDQTLQTQYLHSINELQGMLNKLQVQQKILQSKCNNLANEEQSKDKQIGHLDQTLNKIIVSLSK